MNGLAYYGREASRVSPQNATFFSLRRASELQGKILSSDLLEYNTFTI